jgi:hypothetical protein
MRIARIVKSNSHVDYVGRVLDRLEVAELPAPEHYRFGQFVLIPNQGERGGAVGVIYNSQLVNPDYNRLGPRLSPPPERSPVFTPDILNEQGVLIGILLVGWFDRDGSARQGIPQTVIPVNSEVLAMGQDQVRSFHVGRDGNLALHYYPHVVTHARQFAQQLMLAVLDQLEWLLGDRYGSEIRLLRRQLNWQLVFQSKSL